MHNIRWAYSAVQVARRQCYGISCFDTPPRSKAGAFCCSQLLHGARFPALCRKPVLLFQTCRGQRNACMHEDRFIYTVTNESYRFFFFLGLDNLRGFNFVPNGIFIMDLAVSGEVAHKSNVTINTSTWSGCRLLYDPVHGSVCSLLNASGCLPTGWRRAFPRAFPRLMLRLAYSAFFYYAQVRDPTQELL